MILKRFKWRSEAGDAGGGRANLFRRAHADAQTPEPYLPQRHQAGVQITPDKEQKERRGEIVFALNGVVDGGGEVEAQTHFDVRHPAGPVPVAFASPSTGLAFDAVFGSSREFRLHTKNRLEHGLGVAD